MDPLSAVAVLPADRRQGRLVSGWDVASWPPDKQVAGTTGSSPNSCLAQPDVATAAIALLAAAVALLFTAVALLATHFASFHPSTHPHPRYGEPRTGV